MHCLHITNDYSGSTVYSNLIRELDLIGVKQTIYNPVRDKGRVGVNSVDLRVNNSEIIYRPILNIYSRLHYKYKVKTILKDVLKLIDCSKVDIIHAHTWYSDGGVAYELFKTHNIPYIVTVRNTDIMVFLKYLIHVRSYGLEILKNAKQIIFITPVLLNKLFLSKTLQRNLDLKNKSTIIPNGVDKFWIENTVERKAEASSPLKLIFIGRFTNNKNLDNVISAVKIANDNGHSCHLSIVGWGNNLEAKIAASTKKKSYYTLFGKLSDKAKIAKLLRESDIFIMPSKNETFGLVYIEALSQGIPIIYSKDDGIDGLHRTNIGEAINGDNIQEIVDAIITIAKNYQSYNFSPAKIANFHSWTRIASQYLQLYGDATKND